MDPLVLCACRMERHGASQTCSCKSNPCSHCGGDGTCGCAPGPVDCDGPYTCHRCGGTGQEPGC